MVRPEKVSARFIYTALLCVVAAFFLLSSCNKPRKVEIGSVAPAETPAEIPAETPAGANATVKASRKPLAGGQELAEKLPEPQRQGVSTPLPDEALLKESLRQDKKKAVVSLPERLKKIKFKARREVVWARTTIENTSSYQRALEKFDREFEQWRMYDRIPLEPRKEALQEELDRVVRSHGLEFKYYQAREEPAPVRELPEVIYGNRSFTFEDSDIRMIFQVTIKVDRVPDEKLQALVADIKKMERLVLIRRVQPKHKEVVINLEAYYFRDIKYPVHKIEPLSLDEEMRLAGISADIEDVVKQDSVGYLQNAAMSLKEFNNSLERLNEAMLLLSESKFKEARSTVFRALSENAQRANPLAR
jgi:hypothetical protein